MRGADDADRDGINDRAVAGAKSSHRGRRNSTPTARSSMNACPCDEVSSWRSRDGTKAAASSAMSRNAAWSPDAAARCACATKHAVAKSRPVRQHRGQPLSQGCGIDDIAGFHRPFDAAGIGKRADRKRRRQPGHQPVQRRVAIPAGWRRCGSAIASVASTARRRGFAGGGLFVVMSMGVAVMCSCPQCSSW